jgi:hypothetical protein
MGWLADWDDVIHGTAVFGAAVPLGLSLLLGWRLPRRLWMALAGALIIPVLWIFGWPSWPLNGSDDAVVVGLAVAILLVTVRLPREVPERPRAMLDAMICVAQRTPVWAGLGWFLYPAWLAAEGGMERRLLVSGAMGFSTALWATLNQLLARESTGESAHAFRLTPATWVPPTIALAVLLQFGGATRFAQCAGALAAATGGVCLLLAAGRAQAGLRPLAALWGMLSSLLAWAGWLFAEIHVAAAMALLLTPVVVLASRWLSFPRGTAFREQLWDALAASLVAAGVIATGWLEYSKGGDASGY